MSNKRRLLLQDENGNLVYLEVLASEVLMANGQTAEQAIAAAGQVNTITLNGHTYTPVDKDIDLGNIVIPEQQQADWEEDNPSNPAYIQNKPTVDDVLDEDSENAIANKTVTAAIAQLRTTIESVLGEGSTEAIENFQEVLDFLENVTDDETLVGLLTALQTGINGKVDKSDVYNGLDRTTEGKVLDARQGKALNDLITALNAAVNGKLSGSDVSVSSTGDGTVVITVGTDTYTINLNHTHENMAKLVVCEESELPSTLEADTIYAITDSGETEIEKLIIRGMEFAGGGIPDTGEPMISSPSNGSTINLGDNTAGQGVSKTITIKGKNLTGDLTVAVGTGLTISYGQTLDGQSVTIPMAQALLGAQVTIAYSGSGSLADGSLVISHGNDVLSSVVVVVVAPVNLAAIKLTGTQWLQTDYHINANTKIVMRCTFSPNSNTQTTSNKFYYLSCKKKESGDTQDFAFYAGIEQANQSGPYNFCIKYGSASINTIARTSFVTDDSTLEIYGSTVKFTPHGGSALIYNPNASIAAMTNPLCIGYYIMNGDPRIFNTFDLTIYELTISENNVTQRHYLPVSKNGVPGLLCEETDHFMSSETSDEVEAIQLNS